MRRGRFAVICLVFCVLLFGADSGMSTDQDADQEAVGVAEGTDGVVQWDISVYREGKSWCVVGKATGNSVWTDKLSCEHFDPRKNFWGGPVAIPIARSTPDGAVLFFFVAQKVGLLKVLVVKAAGGYKWVDVPIRRLPEAQVASAGFHQAIAFGVVRVRGLKEFAGGVCLRRVRAFARSGKLIERSPPIICLDSSNPD